ncbi:MAG: hypothetical protein ACR2FM_02200 [Candidatus Saccharimonadales bacterium]
MSSTSETLHDGPLDIVRRINDEAVQFDEIATDYIIYENGRNQMPNSEEEPRQVVERQRKRHTEICQEVVALDNINPLMGQDVSIYGDTLTISIDPDTKEIKAMVLPPGGPRIVPRGRYYGYNIKKVYDPDNERPLYCVVHMLQGKAKGFWDEYGNHHLVTDYMYVRAANSEIVPTVPVNAHSIKDLSRDEAFEDLMCLAFDRSSSRLETIQRVGSFANKLLIEEENEVEKNHQRISYLNSIGLLEGLRILTRDIAVADMEEEESTVTEFSNLEKILEVEPIYLQSECSYQRVNNNTQVQVSATKELYVHGKLLDGRTVMTPLRSILSVS